MKKILLSIAVLALFACSGENNDKKEDGADLSKIEEKMGITICDCLPPEEKPDFSDKEVFKAFQSHIDSCIALEKEVFNELGVEGYNKAQGNCK